MGVCSCAVGNVIAAIIIIWLRGSLFIDVGHGSSCRPSQFGVEGADERLFALLPPHR